MANGVNQRRWLTVIFCLYFLLAVGYSLLMPIWEAPDEGAHFHLAWYLARKDQYATEEKNYEAAQPRGYYYFGSVIIRVLDKINPDFSDYTYPREFKYNIRIPERRFDWNAENYRFLLGVYMLRWVNILFGALALWLNWKAFQVIAPDSPWLRMAALALMALTPQYLHIMSSVNNDTFGTVAGTLLFYLTIQIVSRSQRSDDSATLAPHCVRCSAGERPGGVSRSGQPATEVATTFFSLLTVILAIILPLTTKLTVLPVSAAVLLIIAVKWFFGFRQRKWLIISGLVILVCAAFLYVFFPETIRTAESELTWRLFGLRKKGVDIEYLITITNQILQTYWGKVGWLAVGLPAWVVNSLTALGVVGAGIHIYKLITWKTKEPQFNVWAAILLIALFTILAVARNGLTTGATQGRLLFPAIGALSILMLSGWHDVLPERYQSRLPWIVIALMLLLTIALWMLGIVPVYFQPFLD
jgi:hypothetical protein